MRGWNQSASRELCKNISTKLSGRERWMRGSRQGVRGKVEIVVEAER